MKLKFLCIDFMDFKACIKLLFLALPLLASVATVLKAIADDVKHHVVSQYVTHLLQL